VRYKEPHRSMLGAFLLGGTLSESWARHLERITWLRVRSLFQRWRGAWKPVRRTHGSGVARSRCVGPGCAGIPATNRQTRAGIVHGLSDDHRGRRQAPPGGHARPELCVSPSCPCSLPRMGWTGSMTAALASLPGRAPSGIERADTWRSWPVPRCY